MDTALKKASQNSFVLSVVAFDHLYDVLLTYIDQSCSTCHLVYFKYHYHGLLMNLAISFPFVRLGYGYRMQLDCDR